MGTRFPHSILSTETIISSQFAGSEPGILALSDDSHFLYAGIDGASRVQRFTLPDLGRDINYSLGNGGFIIGANFAKDLQVAPGAPNTTAVTTQQGTVTIFDDATPRASDAATAEVRSSGAPMPRACSAPGVASTTCLLFP